MSVKLIFVDVDDTLLQQTYKKSSRLCPHRLKKAQQNGHKILINTGRADGIF